MPRRKIAMRLMENARARAATYAKRTKGLKKKALELSKLCDAPVALVCAPAPGAGSGARLVWESEEGVLDRYRGAAVPPETRTRHTHRNYLEAELGKEKARLARARHGACHGALADWDAALNDMTADQAREVLETIDAALRAAGDRMVALGLPADGEQVALAPGDDASDNAAAVAPQQLGLEDMNYAVAGFQMQTMPCNGGIGNNDGGLLDQFLWDDCFPMQQQYGLECVGDNYDVCAVNEMQAPAGYGDNADCSWPDLTMCYADGGLRDAVLPAGYYYPKLVDDTLAPEQYSPQFLTGGDYIDTLPLQYPMGMHQNFTNLDNSCTAQWQAEDFQRSDTNSSMDENYTYMNNSYAAHWQAEGQFQHSDAGTGQYQYECSDPDTQLQPTLPLSLLDQWRKS